MSVLFLFCPVEKMFRITVDFNISTNLDAISKLSVLAEDDDCANPNLTKIKKLILEKFRREPDSAGMFMVQKKMYARMMKVREL